MENKAFIAKGTVGILGSEGDLIKSFHKIIILSSCLFGGSQEKQIITIIVFKLANNLEITKINQESTKIWTGIRCSVCVCVCVTTNRFSSSLLSQLRDALTQSEYRYKSLKSS